MKKLVEIRSAQHLSRCVRKLAESLELPLEGDTLDPEIEFTLAAQRAVEAINLLLRDVLVRSPSKLDMMGASLLAIELGNFSLASECIQIEVARIRGEGHDTKRFAELISKTIQNRGLDSSWHSLLKFEQK